MKSLPSIILFFCLIICHYSHGQDYFNNRHNYNGGLEVGWSILETDSGYISVGATGAGKILLYSINSQGNMAWEKSYGKNGFIVYPGTSGSLIKTFDGGYALGGSADNTGVANYGMLYRFDANGDTLWTKTYGDTATWNMLYHCRQSLDSGFVLVGRKRILSSSTGNYWLVKTDKSGNVQWEKDYGGTGEEYCFTVEVTRDGGYILVGYTESFGAGVKDTYVVKVDGSGTVQWSQTYGGTYLDCGGSIAQTSDSGYVIGTCIGQYFLSGTYLQRQARVLKIDSTGGIIWDKTYGPSRMGTDLYSIRELEGGDIVAAGQRANRAGLPDGNGWAEGVILKLNAQGDSLWYRVHQHDTCVKNDDYIRDMKPTSDGGFIIAGFFVPRPVAPCNDTGTQDMWVMKLDSCGCAYLGCDSVCQGLVGIEELEVQGSQLIVYPNPFDYTATIQIKKAEDRRPKAVYIYGLTGQKIKTYRISKLQDTLTLRADDIGTGLFLIQTIDDHGILASGKIIITE